MNIFHMLEGGGGQPTYGKFLMFFTFYFPNTIIHTLSCFALEYPPLLGLSSSSLSIPHVQRYRERKRLRTMITRTAMVTPPTVSVWMVIFSLVRVKQPSTNAPW